MVFSVFVGMLDLSEVWLEVPEGPETGQPLWWEGHGPSVEHQQDDGHGESLECSRQLF